MRAILPAIMAMLLAGEGYGASGTVSVDARNAAIGGISIVGGSASPYRAIVDAGRGLEVGASWANPYGIDGLYESSLSLSASRRNVGLAVFLSSLDTPTPYGEFRALGAISLALAERFSVGAGAGVVWLADSDGVFAQEPVMSLGVALGRPGEVEAGCVAITPGGEGSGDENGGIYRWGVCVPLAGGVSVAAEEERRSGWTLRRFGGETYVGGGLSLRAGVACPPAIVSLGVMLQAKGIGLSLAVSQHEVLGATPYVTLTYGRFSRFPCGAG